MAKRAKLEGDELKAYEDSLRSPSIPTYARPTCQGRSIALPAVIDEDSPLAAELNQGIKQNALIPFGGGLKTWQGSTDNDGRRARLMTERNAPNPFMYDLMGYNSDGAREFPWKETAGTDIAKGVSAQKFFLSPESGAFKLGIRDRNSSPRYFGTSSNINGPQIGWDFFPGTMFGEVLTMAMPNGELPFEIRLRRKVSPGLWAMDVLRPFATKDEFLKAAAAACKSLDAKCQGLTETTPPPRSAAVREFVSAATFGTKRDPLTLSLTAGTALENSASIDELPALPAVVVEKLLRETPFRSVFGQAWFSGDAGKAWAPVNAAAGPSIVPEGYLGAFLPMTRASCSKCHDAAGRHVDGFDPVREQMYDPAPNDAPRARTWYNFIPGNDGILSFHPFSEEAVQSGGNILTADLGQVERQTLDQCFVDFGRPAASLSDDAADEMQPLPAGFVPGPSVDRGAQRPTGPNSSGGAQLPTRRPGTPSTPASGSPGNSSGDPARSGACYCIVQGTQCAVVDSNGKVLVSASAADICRSEEECNNELYGDVATACPSPLRLGR